MIAIFIFS